MWCRRTYSAGPKSFERQGSRSSDSCQREKVGDVSGLFKLQAGGDNPVDLAFRQHTDPADDPADTTEPEAEAEGAPAEEPAAEAKENTTEAETPEEDQ